MKNIQILLADDHEVVRSGFRRLLDGAPDLSVIAETASGEQACSYYLEYHPDVVVMDLSMPGIGGLEAARRILSHDPAARILVFSVHENEVMLSRSLDIGVLGYISKRSASRVMIEAVRHVAAGGVYIGQEMMSCMTKRSLTPNTNRLSGLSTREFEVFRLLAEGNSVNEIANILCISPKTAGHHVTAIKAKLGMANVTGLTRLAIRLGIVSP
jgi:two-component system invasion response regulator UvrY